MAWIRLRSSTLLLVAALTLACQSFKGGDSNDDAKGDDAPTADEIQAMMGSLTDGWEPTPLRGLKSGDSPSEAAAILPGADKLGADGATVSIPVSGPAGVRAIKLQYASSVNGASGGLAYASLIFDEASSNSTGFHDTLRKACDDKFGPPTRLVPSTGEVVWDTKGGWAHLQEDGKYLEPKHFVLTVTLSRR